MDCATKLLSGSDLIHQKLNGPKELPTSGWKEYCPNNSWLEQKQIQVSLEDKYLMIGVERIEKQSNLAKAEWHDDRKKARVLKQIGKHWEVVGHHEDNELWLLPEEALYLLEINVLELFHDGVPVSVEHAYALLLNESNCVTLSEYRVYSYLSRRGYKLIRHAEDIKVTRYEKQVHLDQVLETHKRSIPGERTNNEKQFPAGVSSPEILAGTPNITAGITGKPIQKTSIIKDVIPTVSCRSKRTISDSEDICIIEDNIEIIEIEDISHKIVPQNKREDSCTPAKQSKNKKQCKSKITECLIIIDEELEDEYVQKDRIEKSDSSDSESDDDVILVKSVRLESRKWYKALGRSMLPTEPVFVDLSEDQSVEVKLENGNGQNEGLQIVEQKSIKDILNEMPNAESGISFIKTPKAIFLPKGIVPRHSQYRVNLNMRQEQTIQHNEYFYAPNRRSQQFYNQNFSLNQTNNTYFGDNVLMQACEMRAMALSMIQAASSLMSVVNGTQAQPSLVNDTQIPSFYNSTQFSNPSYHPRLFSNNLFNNNNFFSNSFYNNPRNQYLARNPYGRRNFRFRGNRNNRSFSSHHKHLSRYNSNNKDGNSNNVHEVVLINSEDEAVGEQRGKRGVKHHETPTKKGKFSKPIEIIDLCEEKVVKNEPGVPSKVLGKESSDITEHDYHSEQNDIDQKPDILIECKQESSVFDVEENPQRRFSTDMELKREQTDLQNVEESEIINEKIVESEVKDIELLNINSEKLENQICESPQSCTDIISSESPRIIEESNDSETVDVIVESTVAEFQACVPENKLKDIEQPTSWQQYKEISDQGGKSLDEEMRNGENIVALTQPDHTRDIALLLKSLQIFETIEFDEQKEKKQNLKISFDAYLPTDHFKKSLKMLPKFRIIVVNSTDALPSIMEIDMLKSTYQDEIPFLYAIVFDDAIAFYYYNLISLPEYYDN